MKPVRVFTVFLLTLIFACTNHHRNAVDDSKSTAVPQANYLDEQLESTEVLKPPIIPNIAPYDHLLATSRLKENRTAVVVVFWQGSFVRPKMIANLLGDLAPAVDIYSIQWDWNNPRRNNPLFDKMNGVRKDGAVFIRFPDGTERVITILELNEIRTVLLEKLEKYS